MVDLSRHLRRIIAIEPEHVVVEAGVVPDLLNAQLAPLGRRLEPIAEDSDVTTIGGMIAVDAAGGRSLRYGSTGDQVDWLRVVFAGGEVADLGYEPWPAFEAEPVGLKELIVRKLQTLYRRGADRIRRARSAAPRDRAGYALARAADESGIHLGRLVAGSEGTLALVTQAMLRTVPLPAAQAVVLLPFLRLSEAAAFVPELLGCGPGPSLLRPARPALAPPGPRRRCRSSGTRSTSRPNRSWWSSSRAMIRKRSPPRSASRAIGPLGPDAWPPSRRHTSSGPSASGSWAGGASSSAC